eukprot:Platyproteum_vivax@DN1732_c0_g1_i1.p1
MDLAVSKPISDDDEEEDEFLPGSKAARLAREATIADADVEELQRQKEQEEVVQAAQDKKDKARIASAGRIKTIDPDMEDFALDKDASPAYGNMYKSTPKKESKSWQSAEMAKENSDVVEGWMRDFQNESSPSDASNFDVKSAASVDAVDGLPVDAVGGLEKQAEPENAAAAVPDAASTKDTKVDSPKPSHNKTKGKKKPSKEKKTKSTRPS